jgi:hypothetical protein
LQQWETAPGGWIREYRTFIFDGEGKVEGKGGRRGWFSGRIFLATFVVSLFFLFSRSYGFVVVFGGAGIDLYDGTLEV